MQSIYPSTSARTSVDNNNVLSLTLRGNSTTIIFMCFKGFMINCTCISTTPLLLHDNAPTYKALVAKGNFDRLWIRGTVAPSLFPRPGPV